MHILVPFTMIAAFALPANANAHWPGPGDIVAPNASGLTLTSADESPRSNIPFGSPFHSTMHALVSIYGNEVTVGFLQECGEGPLVYVRIPGQIDLMFQNDRLSGWILSDDTALQTPSGLGVESPRANLAIEGDVEFFDTSIGTEFNAGELFGLLSEDGATLQAIWLGTTCIFR